MGHGYIFELLAQTVLSSLMIPIPLSVLVLVVTGIIAGFSTGLLGVGGGFLMVPVQYWLLSANGLTADLAIRMAFGTSLAVAFVNAISSTWGHHRRGVVLWAAVLVMGPAAAVAGLAGGSIAAYAPASALKILFGVLVIFMGIRMFVPLNREVDEVRNNRTASLVLTGSIGGLVSGLAGIGGGIVLVPLMVYRHGYSIHHAVGTSSACLLFSTAGGIIAYSLNGLQVAGLPPYSVGYINLVQLMVLAAASVPCAQLGVMAAHRLSVPRLRAVFAVVMVIIGLSMILVS